MKHARFNLALRLFIVLFLCFAGEWAQAQQIKLVSGRVLNKEDKLPFKSEAVFVYSFKTVAEAEDAKKKLDEEKSGFLQSVTYELTDENGYYEIRVPDTGALLFKVGLAPSVLEQVKQRMEVDVMIDAGIVMENVDIVGMLLDIRPVPKAPTLIGNKLLLYNNFPIPAQFGKDNARLIIQPFVTNCLTNDTLAFTTPLIYDGEQYRITQKRRMGYNPHNDPLYKYVQEAPLVSERMDIEWNDTILVSDPTQSYQGKAIIQLEDYTNVYYQRSYVINTCEMKRPLKFLEYSTGTYDLDPNQFKVRPRRERRNTAGNISLSFLVGKAELDPDQPENETQLAKLREDILNIIRGEGTTLKEFHITGVASPEGSYQSNRELAQKRVAYAQSQVTSVFPKQIFARVYQNPQAMVASWADVANLLEADSLIGPAEAIHTIVTQYQHNKEMQFQQIYRLPSYQTVIKKYLPQLRTVKYEYIHEIFRELTPEEILDRYLHDEDYISGRKQFTLYEYWHLFGMEQNPSRLEKLYRRAYEDSKELSGQPWILAANLLAVSYLKRDTADISILAPFVDKTTRGTNIVRKRMDGVTEEIINREEIIINQMAMLLKSNNYEEASILAQILPDSQVNEKLKAFARCLGGYYRGGNTTEERQESQRVFDIVKSSSIINEVVMCLALDNPRGNKMAEIAAPKLPDDNPVSWYLRAIINSRKGELGMEETKNCLISCFRLDEKYIRIAETDGDLEKDFVDYALDMYQLEKEME